MTKKLKNYNKNKNKNTNKNNIKININTTSKKRLRVKSTYKQGQPTVIYNNIPTNNNSNHELM